MHHGLLEQLSPVRFPNGDQEHISTFDPPLPLILLHPLISVFHVYPSPDLACSFSFLDFSWISNHSVHSVLPWMLLTRTVEPCGKRKDWKNIPDNSDHRTKQLNDNQIVITKPKMGFPQSSVGKESTCNAGDCSSIPGSGRSAGGGIGYPTHSSILGLPLWLSW